MDKILLHSCCAPCSVYCVDTLRGEGIEPVSLWFNPNIHPWTEYDQRRSEIPQFWDGDARDEAYEVIGANIANVKTAYQAVEENMKAFKEADDEGNKITTETKQKLEDARKQVQSLFQS